MFCGKHWINEKAMLMMEEVFLLAMDKDEQGQVPGRAKKIIGCFVDFSNI